MDEEEQILEEDVADYQKGEGQIILEEFLITLVDLPGAIQDYLVIAPLNILVSLISRFLTWFYSSVYEPRLVWLNVPNSCIMQFIFTIRYSSTVDQYE
jgi:hypothetical protein